MAKWEEVDAREVKWGDTVRRDMQHPPILVREGGIHDYPNHSTPQTVIGGYGARGQLSWWPGLPYGTKVLREVKVSTVPLRRLAVNPDPVKIVSVPKCRTCGMRAPWCSCGRGDYS